MPGIVHHMTAAMFVLHLMVGCCDHHAHDCTATGDVSESQVDAHGCPSCADSHDAGAHDQAGQRLVEKDQDEQGLAWDEA